MGSLAKKAGLYVGSKNVKIGRGFHDFMSNTPEVGVEDLGDGRRYELRKNRRVAHGP